MSRFLRALRCQRFAVVAVLAAALFAASVPIESEPADAAGPPYPGPFTEATGPAYFGPAPNPFPYCENPTYFDPFPENVTPIGSIDVTGSPNASVTTDGITMDFELTANGTFADPDGQYPGFFPFEGLGSANDQAKGVEMASDDAAIINLSEPLFYTQWVFTDVDRANEGFFVTPTWTDPGAAHALAVFGGDTEFEFDGTTENLAAFNDTNAAAEDSESINGRVQVDLIGAVTGITLVRDTGNGQSGFAIGGGCSPLGVAKTITSGPTWNGSSFDVTYTIRVRNNLPSATTINDDIAGAIAAAASGTTAGTVDGIEMTQVQLTDVLTDSAFGEIDIVSLTNTSGQVEVNFPGFDGVSDTNVIAPDETIPAETEEEFVLVLQYTPEISGPLGSTCSAAYSLLNSAVASGVAAGVPVEDESDDGVDPDPGVDNGDGGTDDTTVVEFPCPPPPADGAIDLSKTVVGPGGSCATAVEGVDELVVGDVDSSVTWCFTITNSGEVPLTALSFDDPLLELSDIDVLAVYGGAAPSLAPTASISFEIAGTIPEGGATNTVSVDGLPSSEDGIPTGADPVSDTDAAEVEPTPASPGLQIVKTVVEGPNGTCPANVTAGIPGDGPPLPTQIGATVTYCLNVANTGDVALENVVATDPQAPAGFDGTIGALAAGAEALASFDVVITTDTPLLNTATVTGDVPGGGGVPPTEDTAIVDPAGPVPAVELVKTVLTEGGDCETAVEGTDELVIGTTGDPIVWCFVVTNVGNVPLASMTFEDAPVELIGVDLLAEYGSGPSLAVAESIRFQVPGTIPAGGLDNVATVDGSAAEADGTLIDGIDPVQDQNEAAIDEVSADLAVTKSVSSAGPLPVGALLTYTIVVTNNGPDPAEDPTLTDRVPTGIELEGLPSSDEWSCALNADGFDCARTGPLAVGASENLTYTARSNTDAPVGSALTNTVAVDSPTADPDPTNNEDTSTTTTGVTPSELPVAPEYPGPFTPTVPASPDPAEPPPVVPLAVTGASSLVLASLSTVFLALGGVLAVLARRERFET